MVAGAQALESESKEALGRNAGGFWVLVMVTEVLHKSVQEGLQAQVLYEEEAVKAAPSPLIASWDPKNPPTTCQSV